MKNLNQDNKKIIIEGIYNKVNSLRISVISILKRFQSLEKKIAVEIPLPGLDCFNPDHGKLIRRKRICS